MEAAAASPAASARGPSAPERAIPHAPPNPASSSSHRRSDRSTAASRAGQDSSSTARRRFLSLVAQATTWSRCDERARAASRASPRPGTPDRESGTPRAVRAITAASRSSVLASPANRPAARLAGGRGGEQRVELGLPVADGGAGQHLPVAVDQAGPVRRLADVQAEHGRGSGGWRFHGGILPVVVRPDGLPPRPPITSRVPNLSAVGGGASRAGSTQQALSGAGTFGRARAPGRRPVLGAPQS